MTGDREINQSVVEHVVNMRNRLVEFTSMVKRNLENRKEKVKLWYDKKAVMGKFSAGDEVLVLLPSDTHKMLAQWKGPFRVVERVNNTTATTNVDFIINIVDTLNNTERSFPLS